MKSQTMLKHLKMLSNHLHYYNNMAPFNVFDSEYVENVDKLKQMIQEDNTKEYDDEPVVACKYCKS